MSDYNYRHDLSVEERLDLLFECVQDMNEAISSLSEGIQGLQQEIDIICKHIDGEEWWSLLVRLAIDKLNI